MRSSVMEPNFVQERDSIMGWPQGLEKRDMDFLSSLMCEMRFPPYLTAVVWFWLSDAVITEHAHLLVTRRNQMGFLITFHVCCRSATALYLVPLSLKGAAGIWNIGISVAGMKGNVGTTCLLLLLLGHGTDLHLYSTVQRNSCGLVWGVRFSSTRRTVRETW